MRTSIVMTLLVLSTLAPLASACPDPVDTAYAVATCAASIVGPDGQDEQIGNVDTGVDVIDQQHPCTN